MDDRDIFGICPFCQNNHEESYMYYWNYCEQAKGLIIDYSHNGICTHCDNFISEGGEKLDIKAIETYYNGYRFRSRLEARWAVFFDTLGVKYEYEPEGFQLPSGRYYLPDFKVTCYGTRGTCIESERIELCTNCKKFSCYDYDKCEWLYCDKADFESNAKAKFCNEFVPEFPFDLYIEVKGVMTAKDAEKINEFSKYYPILVVNQIPNLGCSHDSEELGVYRFMNDCGVFPFNYETIDGDHFGAYPAAYKGKFFLWGDDGNYIWNEKEVENAYTQARQARFEHGEKG